MGFAGEEQETGMKSKTVWVDGRVTSDAGRVTAGWGEAPDADADAGGRGISHLASGRAAQDIAAALLLEGILRTSLA
jgi:hypothetical protein